MGPKDQFFNEYAQKVINDKTLQEINRAQKIQNIEDQQANRIKKLLQDSTKKFDRSQQNVEKLMGYKREEY